MLTIVGSIVSATDLPSLVDYGRVPYDEVVQRVIRVENDGDEPVFFDFMSTCPCVSVEPNSLSIDPGETGTIEVELDPYDYSGEVEKLVMVRSSVESHDRSLLRVWAHVTRPADAAVPGCSECELAAETVQEEGFRRWLRENWLVIDIYYTEGCRECEEIVTDTIPKIREELSLRVSVRKHNVLEPEQYELMMKELDRRDVEISGLPVITVGDRVLSSKQISHDRLKDAMAAATEAPSRQTAQSEDSVGHVNPSDKDKKEPLDRGDRDSGENTGGGGVDPRTVRRLAIVPVVAAGLVDGVNPCAFATLLFLLSSLAVVGRNRREILLVGAVFAAAVFATYFALGVGLFHALRAASYFPTIAKIIRLLMVGLLVAFSALSLYDWLLVRRGKASKMVLQLPDSVKKRIHSSVRTNVRGYSIVAGAVVMGITVSVFELGCTGQVYFPTISYMVQSGGELAGYGLLALYNLGFIAPLLVLFTAVYFGIGSHGLLRFFRANLGTLKLVLAGAFLALAVLTIVT